MKVLFVCRGNVARSQFAEVFFNNICRNKGIAISAGTETERYARRFLGEYATYAVKCMEEMGYDISKNVSKQLTLEMVKMSDRVIVMAEKETWPKFLKMSKKVEIWNVQDPGGKDYNSHCATRDVIINLVETYFSE